MSTDNEPLDVAADDLRHRIILINLIFTFELALLIPYGIWELTTGHMFFGLLDFTVAAATIVFATYLQITRNYLTVAYGGTLTTGLLFVIIFAQSDPVHGGHLWSYAFPMFAVLFLGGKRGVPLIIGFLLAILAILLFQLTPQAHAYQPAFVYRFVGAFIACSLIAFTFDVVLARQHNALQKRNHRLIGTLDDVRKVEQQLRASEQKYRSLVERARIGICIIIDSKIVFANQYLASLLGYAPDEMTNIPISRVVHPDSLPLVDAHYHARMDIQPNLATYEALLLHRDGSSIDVELNGGAIDYNGRRADLGLVNDIRERKQAMEEHAHLERQRSAIAMAVTASHELNQPLMILRGNIELLQMFLEKRSLSEDADKYMHNIERSMERIQKLLQNFHQAESVQFEDYSGCTEMAVLSDWKEQDQ